MWCVKCGRQSPVVVTELAATRSMKETRQEYKATNNAFASSGRFSVILGVIPIILLIQLLPSIMSFDTNSAIGLLGHLFTKAMAISLFFPFLLVGFHTVCNQIPNDSANHKSADILSAYPRYLLMSLVSSLYYIIIYLICYGLPQFGSDPILRLVWIVLMQYWIVLLLPVPVLMEEHGYGFYRSLRLSYRHFHVVRWNLYLMLLILVIINGIPFGISMYVLSKALVASGALKFLLFFPTLLFLIPLAFTLPYSWMAVRNYTNRLMEYELLNQ
jgi:hypothetical protein